MWTISGGSFYDLFIAFNKNKFKIQKKKSIGEMATEESKLLRKSSRKTFNYLSTASVTVAPKLKECTVVLPKISETANNNDG